MSGEVVVEEKKQGNPHIKVIADINNFERQGRLIKMEKELNPLDDGVFEYLADLAEPLDGEHPAFQIKLRRVAIWQNSKLDDFEGARTPREGRMVRVRLKNMESMDIDCIQRYKNKYALKYPRTLSKL